MRHYSSENQTIVSTVGTIVRVEVGLSYIMVVRVYIAILYRQSCTSIQTSLTYFTLLEIVYLITIIEVNDILRWLFFQSMIIDN